MQDLLFALGHDFMRIECFLSIDYKGLDHFGQVVRASACPYFLPSLLTELCSYINLRRQRPMNRALPGNFEQLGALLGIERTGQFNVALDSVQHTFLGFTLGTI